MPRSMKARRLRLSLLAPICVACAVAPAAASAAPAVTDGHGLQVLSVSVLDKRLLDVTVSSATLPGPAHVRILLPANYESTTRRFPVFYLLHGTSGGAADWTVKGEAEQATAGLPVIVVMPDIVHPPNT